MANDKEAVEAAKALATLNGEPDNWRSYWDAAQAAIEAARPHIYADRWQDIATAPKDGTVIDVWVDGEFPCRRTDVSWREPSDSEWWAHGGDTIETPDATWHDCFGPLGQSEQPTHWMPHPTPPENRHD